MSNFISRLFGGTEIDFNQLIKEGAVILDVRSKGEYGSGHIKGSVNIPVDQLNKQLDQLKDKEKTIITCCASGGRSSTAKGMLESNGYKNVHNGGGWSSLQSKLQK